MHEDRQIARAARFRPNQSLLLGIGDDAALLQPSVLTQVWAVDTLVENTHFLRTMPADQIGWKLLAVNLSDFAAMNARPLAALLSLGLPPDLDPRWLEAFWNGLEDACSQFDVALAGGDTVRASELHLSLSLLGDSPRPIRRTGALAGDLLLVTGAFGGAAAGLHCFRENINEQALLRRHWHPEPRFTESQTLAANCERLAMLDTSDGLARSLQLICQANGLGCEVEAGLIPIEPGIATLVPDAQALDWAINGGEDYELLAAVPPQAAAWLVRDPHWTVIGQLTASPEQIIHFADHSIELQNGHWGFQHF